MGQLGKWSSLDRRNPSIRSLLLGPVEANDLLRQKRSGINKTAVKHWKVFHRKDKAGPGLGLVFNEANQRTLSLLVDGRRLNALLQQTSNARTPAVLRGRVKPVNVDRVHVLVRVDGVIQVEPPLSRKTLHYDTEPRRPKVVFERGRQAGQHPSVWLSMYGWRRCHRL